jgi:ubiquinone/menaquinone biosynthesis C-methylase UbiE
MTSDQPEKGTYFIDVENAAEMARLTRLDRTMNTCMRGLFSQHPDLSAVRDTLDIACGPGAWAMEMAYSYPCQRVIGIDISQIMTRYAQAQAKMQGLENVQFLVMDARKPFTFPDASFDLVNARLIDGFMLKETWPQLLAEMLRILRPGGIMRITETDSWGLSNSLALEKLTSLNVRALFAAGRTFSPYPFSQHLGITPMLPLFFEQAGCQQIQLQPHVLDFSTDAPAHLSHCENYKIGFKLMQPFLIKQGVTTQEELDQLYQQMLIDMTLPNFRALVYLLSVWGTKPLNLGRSS